MERRNSVVHLTSLSSETCFFTESLFFHKTNIILLGLLKNQSMFTAPAGVL